MPCMFVSISKYLYGALLVLSTSPYGRGNSVHIINGPQNTYAVLGSQAELICLVTDQGQQDFVFWKKMSDAKFPDMISYNDWSKNTTKYHITIRFGRYTLYIHNVDMSDEGKYECQAGGDTAQATLNISVPVHNMTLEWDTAKPLPRDSLVNLTCQTYHSKPPADITWLVGGKNVSNDAFYNVSYNIDGFGDVTSVIEVDTGSGVAGMPYRCIALVPGQEIENAPYLYDYVTVVTFPSNVSTKRELSWMLSLVMLGLIVQLRWFGSDLILLD